MVYEEELDEDVPEQAEVVGLGVPVLSGERSHLTCWKLSDSSIVCTYSSAQQLL